MKISFVNRYLGTLVLIQIVSSIALAKESKSFLGIPYTANEEKRSVEIELTIEDPSSTNHFELRRPYHIKTNTVEAGRKTKEKIVRMKLYPDHFQIRFQSIDSRGIEGEWSEWQDLPVHYKTPASVYPKPDMVIKARGVSVERVTFDWPTYVKADGYLFVLNNADGTHLKVERTSESKMIIDLPLGHSFSWTVWPLLKGLALGDDPLAKVPSELKYYRFSISEKPEGHLKEAILLAEKDEKANFYEFEYSEHGAKGKTAISKIQSFEPSVPLGLLPGSYSYRSRIAKRGNAKGKWSDFAKVHVPFDQAQTIAPINDEQIVPTTSGKSQVTLTWNLEERASIYDVRVFDATNEGSSVFAASSETATVVAELDNNKIYKWEVLPRGKDAPEPALPEKSTGNSRFTIRDYNFVPLAEAEEPSNFYGWGRWLASIMNFSGSNFDLNSEVEQSLYGGTGEIAIGRWLKDSSYGGLLQASLSGFSIEDRIVNYGSAGFNVGYRKVEGNNRLRLWLGVNYNELPEVLFDPEDRTVNTRIVKSIGPQFQLSYMGDFKFDPKYGWQIYGVVYRNSFPVSTPNGRTQTPAFSYTLGAFGSYKMSSNQKWLIGYSYRKQALTYESVIDGFSNKSEISGHFLSLSVEVGLENFDWEKIGIKKQ